MKQSDTRKLSILIHPAGKVGQILFPAIFHPVRIKVVFHIHIIQSAIEVISTVNFLFMNRSFLYVQYQGKRLKIWTNLKQAAFGVKNKELPFSVCKQDSGYFFIHSLYMYILERASFGRIAGDKIFLLYEQCITSRIRHHIQTFGIFRVGLRHLPVFQREPIQSHRSRYPQKSIPTIHDFIDDITA